MKLKFELVMPARKSGGDKYEAKIEGEDRPFVIYFPQVISRSGTLPKPWITLDIED